MFEHLVDTWFRVSKYPPSIASLFQQKSHLLQGSFAERDMSRWHPLHVWALSGYLSVDVTVSTESAASPKSANSRNSGISVPRGTNSNWHCGLIWICTEKSEFLDLVDFGSVSISVESAILRCDKWAWQFPLKMLHPRNPANPETHIPRYKFKLNQISIWNL